MGSLNIDALWFALLAVGGALAGILLVALRMQWNAIKKELDRDIGWSIQWTERIMDTLDEKDESGPP